ncbi:hypothetical protein NF681_06945 [Comamonadaceae bacterium OTU4NAUVB1]|nr:hypothetical protein NF681_06945 [Comamonadaceae bacterium OTU4NAUVB1]
MATRKSTQAAPAASVNDFLKVASSADPAIESLLSEIAALAHRTDHRLRLLPCGDGEIDAIEVDTLRDVVMRMGWMADVALQRLDSINTMRNGHAEQWLLPPSCITALLGDEVGA